MANENAGRNRSDDGRYCRLCNLLDLDLHGAGWQDDLLSNVLHREQLQYMVQLAMNDDLNDDDPFQIFDDVTAFLCVVALVALAFILLHFG